MRNVAKQDNVIHASGPYRKRIFTTSNLQNFTASLFRTVIIIGISYIILFPILTRISSSLMMERDLFDQTVRWIPRSVTMDNFKMVWEHMRYPEAFANSFMLALGVALLQLASCTLIGYGFARFEFIGKEIWFGLVIFTLVVPIQVVMIPLYLNFRYFNILGIFPNSLNLLNSYWPIILMSGTGTGLRNGLFIYIMRQFFRGMPKDLEEAAYVDGAGPIRTFFAVMLPGATPALVIVFLFSFVWQWNEDFLTNMFMNNQVLLPITLDGLVRSVHGSVQVSEQYASLLNNTGSLMFVAPLLLLYAVMQRYFVESIERTGIVG